MWHLFRNLRSILYSYHIKHKLIRQRLTQRSILSLIYIDNLLTIICTISWLKRKRMQLEDFCFLHRLYDEEAIWYLTMASTVNTERSQTNKKTTDKIKDIKKTNYLLPHSCLNLPLLSSQSLWLASVQFPVITNRIWFKKESRRQYQQAFSLKQLCLLLFFSFDCCFTYF